MGLYSYRTVMTVGDTNLFQNVYFTTYFKLSGVVRELWVRECVPNCAQHLAAGLRLITSRASCTFILDFALFDPVRCEMTIQRLRRASADLVFRFFHDATGVLHAEARHTIVFADANHKICEMPEDFHRAALAIEERERERDDGIVLDREATQRSRSQCRPMPRPSGAPGQWLRQQTASSSEAHAEQAASADRGSVQPGTSVTE